jgi:glycosyltransferase involved in cell wall biosynthesis
MTKHKNPPAISILVTVFNTALYLPKLLDSILAQSFSNFEVICINDGSTDQSVSVLHDYSQNDSRISYFSQDNHGPGNAKERALSLATGKYVLFLDSDDFIEPDTLGVVYQRAEILKAQIVAFPYDIFSEESGIFHPVPSTVDDKYLPDAETFSSRSIPTVIFQVLTPELANKLWLRSFLSENNIHFGNLSYAEDYFVMYWSLSIADRVTTVHDKAYYHYRKGHTGALTAENKAPLAFITAYKAFKEKLSDLGLYQSLHQSYLNRTLSGIVYEYSRHESESTKQRITDYLRKEGLLELGFQNEPVEYFYNEDEYREFTDILDPPGMLRSFFIKTRLLTQSTLSLPSQALNYLRKHGWKATMKRVFKNNS